MPSIGPKPIPIKDMASKLEKHLGGNEDLKHEYSTFAKMPEFTEGQKALENQMDTLEQNEVMDVSLKGTDHSIKSLQDVIASKTPGNAYEACKKIVKRRKRKLCFNKYYCEQFTAEIKLQCTEEKKAENKKDVIILSSAVGGFVLILLLLLLCCYRIIRK